MKNVPVILEGSFLGTKVERFGDNSATMAMFLIGVDSVPMFVPSNMDEIVAGYLKMIPGVIKATVTFRDNKPGGYFQLKDFVCDRPAENADKKSGK